MSRPVEPEQQLFRPPSAETLARVPDLDGPQRERARIDAYAAALAAELS